MAKIVHIAQDQKFIDWAIGSFERAQPGANELILVSDAAPKTVATKPKVVLARKDARSGGLERYTEGADLIVLHALGKDWTSFVARNPGLPFVWLGWGYDYYDLIVRRESELHLPKTNALLYSDGRLLTKRLRKKAKSFISQGKDQEKLSAIKNITTLALGFEEEYTLLKQALPFAPPQYMSWKYGAVESMVGSLLGQTVNGTDVLVGNSATSSSNHIEAFELLAQRIERGRRVVVPLSYGDKRYGKAILKRGPEILGNQFVPLVDFIPLPEYIETIRSCGFVIMNHIRQQAVGSIITMLHLGAKIFLREESPTYQFLKRIGALVFTVQQLERDPSLMQSLLTEGQIQHNRAVLGAHWSRAVVDAETMKLIEVALQRSVAYAG